MKKTTEEIKKEVEGASKKEVEAKETTLEWSKEKLKECEKLRNEYLAGWQRAKADFLNYKKEEMERAEFFLEMAKKKWFLKFLEILDNFERAQNHIPEDLKKADWAQGVLQIENQFRNFLNQEGVEEIKAEGERFDPRFHEAIGEVKGEGEPGTVADVLQKGYMLNGELLRPAKVKVIK